MKKMLKGMLAAAAALFVLSGAVGAYAYFSDIAAVKNHISLGDVNIGLKEYELKNGKEAVYENPKRILPGDSISKIPRITNYGEPCWIRAAISFQNGSDDLEGFSEKNIIGISQDWVKRGEYYYYTKILGRTETVSLFTGVTVPWQWTEAHENQKLAVEIRTDAIQAVHFSPDFQAMSPWGDQKIELCVHEVDGTETNRRENAELSVEFQGEAHKLVAVPGDFFSNFGRAMPGDVLKDSVDISNTTSKDAEIFFHTGLVCQREDRMDLLRKLGLTITMDGRTLYTGNLMALELAEEVSLGTFSPGSQGTMEFAVSVPAELGNAYALRDTLVKWYFTVYENDPEMEDTPSQRTIETPLENPAERKASPKTGDETPLGDWMLLLGAAIAAGGTALIIWKGGSKA